MGVRSLSVGIVFISYMMHVKYQPFMDQLSVKGGTLSQEHVAKDGSVLSYVFSYNRLEAYYLVASMFVLLCGMIFESAFLLPGSTSYTALTVVVSFTRVCASSPLPLFDLVVHNRHRSPW